MSPDDQETGVISVALSEDEIVRTTDFAEMADDELIEMHKRLRTYLTEETPTNSGLRGFHTLVTVANSEIIARGAGGYDE